MPKPGTARGVQIDLDPTRLSLRYPMEVNMAGDAATALRALLPMLEPKQPGAWREGIAADVANWWRLLEDRAVESDPRLIIMVLNNQDLSQVTWEERVQLGEGKTESTQVIPDFAYHSYAELLGLKGIVVRDPERIGPAWDEALAADRPVILNIYADPNVPPLPPHITFKDAKNFLSMMRTEPELGSVVKNSVKQVLAGVLPGRG